MVSESLGQLHTLMMVDPVSYPPTIWCRPHEPGSCILGAGYVDVGGVGQRAWFRFRQPSPTTFRSFPKVPSPVLMSSSKDGFGDAALFKIGISSRRGIPAGASYLRLMNVYIQSLASLLPRGTTERNATRCQLITLRFPPSPKPLI